MKRIEYWVVAAVAIALGTGMHFVHHAPFFNEIWGLVFPVRESVWEHMKMLLYPLLIESVYLAFRRRDARAIAGPILVAAPAFAVQIALFFAYFVFTGHEIEIVDVIAYIVVMAAAVWVGDRWSSREAVRKMWPLAAIVAVVLVVAVGRLTYHYPNHIVFRAMGGENVVRVEGGLVQGVQSGESVVFKGIPYAAAPVGELRWRAPQPVEDWDTIMVCDRFRNAGPQATHNPEDGNYGTEFFPTDAPFSEDCLQLNIWTPAQAVGEPEAKLPVALWIHGGGYSAGWSFEPEMDGEAWAERGVILVTANYRLGVLGYLSHPLLTAESGTSGNYGLMDQIAALKWVKRNIAAFGGDPERVMIFGQSAGGGSIRCMLISPESKDLVSSAIVMSAGGLNGRLRETMTQEEADQLGKAVMDHGGFTTLEQMRAATWEQLQGALNSYAAVHRTWIMLCPHIDGQVLTESFDSAAYGDRLARVPMMFGSVADDMAGLDTGFAELAALRDSLGDAPTYIYRFDAAAPEDGRPCLHGSFHSSELWYVFATQSRSWRPYTEADRQLSERMVDAWTNMAKNGCPGWAVAPWVEPLEREN